jgi:hypothetical protein
MLEDKQAMREEKETTHQPAALHSPACSIDGKKLAAGNYILTLSEGKTAGILVTIN